MADKDNIRPDAVGSAAAASQQQHPPFDETNYQELRRFYLEKRNRTAPVIEYDTPGYRALRTEIKRLECKGDHTSIYALLQRLALFDMRKAQFPTVSQQKKRNGDDQDAIVEVVDLTADDDKNQEITDVDKYILDVLLVKVIKPDPDAVGSASSDETTNESASGQVHIKKEPFADDHKAFGGKDSNNNTKDEETIAFLENTKDDEGEGEGKGDHTTWNVADNKMGEDEELSDDEFASDDVRSERDDDMMHGNYTDYGYATGTGSVARRVPLPDDGLSDDDSATTVGAVVGPPAVFDDSYQRTEVSALELVRKQWRAGPPQQQHYNSGTYSSNRHNRSYSSDLEELIAEQQRAALAPPPPPVLTAAAPPPPPASAPPAFGVSQNKQLKDMKLAAKPRVGKKNANEQPQDSASRARDWAARAYEPRDWAVRAVVSQQDGTSSNTLHSISAGSQHENESHEDRGRTHYSLTTIKQLHRLVQDVLSTGGKKITIVPRMVGENDGFDFSKQSSSIITVECSKYGRTHCQLWYAYYKQNPNCDLSKNLNSLKSKCGLDSRDIFGYETKKSAFGTPVFNNKNDAIVRLYVMTIFSQKFEGMLLCHMKALGWSTITIDINLSTNQIPNRVLSFGYVSVNGNHLSYSRPSTNNETVNNKKPPPEDSNSASSAHNSGSPHNQYNSSGSSSSNRAGVPPQRHSISNGYSSNYRDSSQDQIYMSYDPSSNLKRASRPQCQSNSSVPYSSNYSRHPEGQPNSYVNHNGHPLRQSNSSVPYSSNYSGHPEGQPNSYGNHDGYPRHQSSSRVPYSRNYSGPTNYNNTGNNFASHPLSQPTRVLCRNAECELEYHAEGECLQDIPPGCYEIDYQPCNNHNGNHYRFFCSFRPGGPNFESNKRKRCGNLKSCYRHKGR